ncbi:MAG: FAD-dependent oxidoreductase [Lutibacter sp.]|uniref:glycerol-3-phosphate dehydrogenase/oxidase n=1 Tax=Lutibacter sp. TaxID=1925666 RepID=UPI0019DCA33F|nr:glycerol-3-phosphate dehydrogenase/oxidase [Lutibacter sp.]NOR28698.1 FAD-dependent oxidoreductase [Lutibacter sp.]
MNRTEMMNSISKNGNELDFIVIGGGATGLGIALEASSRGYSVILLEQDDFTKGTSSRSTKLVHGGVRYLAQGKIALVKEALRERGFMKKNAPHLVKNQSFIIPAYKWWIKPYYTIGLTIYDLLSGRLSLGWSVPTSKQKTLECIPTLKTKGLKGGVMYHDGQFDDARFGINLCQTIIEKGGIALNYMKVSNLIKTNNKVTGVVTIDQETKIEYQLKGKAIINATGVFIDDIIKMDTPNAPKMVRASQGVHVVLDKEFVPNNCAIMIPKTSDGRVLFAVPWHNKVIVGTTDVLKETAELEPVALEKEINFILETAGRFLAKQPKRTDVKSVFAGLRPLAAPKEGSLKTKEISRSHKIIISTSGMLTITGGKWTTYRKMAEDVINKLIKKNNFKQTKSNTEDLKIHGYKETINYNNPLYVYGSDEDKVLKLAKSENLEDYLSESLKIIKAQVIWGARYEMARTVEDILARRTRALFLDAKESVRIAPEVANLLAKEFGYTKEWEENQIIKFNNIAKNYILN